jgi:enoyl-CoA hydratase/carnithine racemase
MPHPHLLVQPGAGYTWLRLSRPERRNALDASLARALRDELAAQPSRPLLLGSTDPQVFCAGADLTISDAERATVSDLIYDCCEVIITRPGPVIAVVTGAAVGGGAQLAAAADLRIAGAGARLRWTGPPGVDLVVGAWLLPDLVGRSVAMDLALTGRWMDSAEAAQLGLVNRIAEKPETVAEEIASGLTARPAVKKVMASGDLMERLRAERLANQAAWADRIGRIDRIGR